MQLSVLILSTPPDLTFSWISREPSSPVSPSSYLPFLGAYGPSKVIAFYIGSVLELYSTHVTYKKKIKSETLWLNNFFLNLSKGTDLTIKEVIVSFAVIPPPDEQKPLVFESIWFHSKDLFFTSKKWIILQNKTNLKTFPWKIRLVRSFYNYIFSFSTVHCLVLKIIYYIPLCPVWIIDFHMEPYEILC